MTGGVLSKVMNISDLLNKKLNQQPIKFLLWGFAAFSIIITLLWLTLSSSVHSSAEFTLMSLFFIVLSVFLGHIHQRVRYPLYAIQETLNILKHGDLSKRIASTSLVPLELKAIRQGLNELASNSEKTTQELQLIFDNAGIGITWVENRHYLTVNNKLLSIFGYTREEFIGQSTRLIYCNNDDYERVGNGYKTITLGETYTTEVLMQKKDGSTFWCHLTGRSMGSGNSSVWLFEDISARKIAEEKLYIMANYDTLTTLANRDLFNIHLQESIAKSYRNKRSFALMFIDLDRFKYVNDSFGHNAGDAILKEAAIRMKNTLRESDLISRLSGDEFTIIIDETSSKAGIETVARNLLNELSRVITYEGNEIYIGGSIGISRYPNDSTTASELLGFADSAMYVAKNSGRNTFTFYSKEIGRKAEKHLSLSQGLNKAFENDEFELHYQTKVDMKSRTVIGAEALIRWRKPNEGLIPPFEFISVLEESGLMADVGEWVIFEACRSIKKWQEIGINLGPIAINLSERQFGTKSLIDVIKSALSETGVKPEHLEFEITESLMVDDSKRIIDALTEIKKLGIKVAIDDFGTGYSSLAYLKRFPIDILKIDRAFVKDISEDKDSAIIVDAIIAMAKQLNLTTVAEGIETEAQYALLANRGCDIAQGFLLSKPVPYHQIVEKYSK